MAYSAVPTISTNDPWTAANHNTYLRDNFIAGVPDIFTTDGDLAYATGANAASRLGKGSISQTLKLVAGVPAWATIDSVRVTRSALQTISTATSTLVTFDVEIYDNGGYHSTVSNTDRITIPSVPNGFYWIYGSVQFAGNNTGYRELRLKFGGGIYARLRQYGQISSNTLNIGMVLFLAATNYLQLEVYQNSGGNLNLLQQNGLPVFGATRLP